MFMLLGPHLQNMTRERARNRTAAEWASQKELIAGAIGQEKPRKVAQRKAEEQAIALPVQVCANECLC